MFFVDPRSAPAERDRAALHPASSAVALAKVDFVCRLRRPAAEAFFDRRNEVKVVAKTHKKCRKNITSFLKIIK